MKLKIYPADILKKKALPIVTSFADFQKIGEQMLKLMYKSSGIGLAANQVGLDKRVFVIDIPKSRQGADQDDAVEEDAELLYEPQIYLNPEILNAFDLTESEEGCLSIPTIKATVQRYNHLEVSYYTTRGELIKEKLQGLKAFCFQHELDHLNAILFWDHLSHAQRKELKKQFKNNKEEVE